MSQADHIEATVLSTSLKSNLGVGGGGVAEAPGTATAWRRHPHTEAQIPDNNTLK